MSNKEQKEKRIYLRSLFPSIPAVNNRQMDALIIMLKKSCGITFQCSDPAFIKGGTGWTLYPPLSTSLMSLSSIQMVVQETLCSQIFKQEFIRLQSLSGMSLFLDVSFFCSPSLGSLQCCAESWVQPSIMALVTAVISIRNQPSLCYHPTGIRFSHGHLLRASHGSTICHRDLINTNA